MFNNSGNESKITNFLAIEFLTSQSKVLDEIKILQEGSFYLHHSSLFFDLPHDSHSLRHNFLIDFKQIVATN